MQELMNIQFVIEEFKTITNGIRENKIPEKFTPKDLEFKLGYNINKAYNNFVRLCNMGFIIQENYGKLEGTLVSKEYLYNKLLEATKGYKLVSIQESNNASICEKFANDVLNF